jgi:hypothetical protein
MNTWQLQMAQNAATHRDEIEADLAHAIHLREQAKFGFDEADSRVRSLEYLLSLADEVEAGAPPQETMKLHEAMVEVLKSDPTGMSRAVHIAAAINERGLYRMRDGRPVEGQQITARVGRYPHLFDREGTFIKLK